MSYRTNFLSVGLLQKCILFVLAFQFFALQFVLQGAQKGNVVILYGTSCSGKSTFAKELQKELPGRFYIVKKTPLVEENKKDLIEAFTGKRPKGRAEAKETTVHLPPPHRRMLYDKERDGLKDTIAIVKPLVDQGANLIFDVCTSDQRFLEDFKGYDPIVVLVYAPLSVLPQRLKERKKQSPPSEFTLQRKKSLFLYSFSNLYMPVEDSAEVYVDILSRKDLFEQYSASENALIYPRLQTNLQRIVEEFGLEKKEKVKFVARKKPDLIVNTDQISIKEECQRVAFLLKKP